ncbi:hypothetical protein BUALT_Bualt13G0024000 [Buddleja alternifolia]|uniref:Uncharacterized protein n=1 Tax=Buddleja alternifolia TaxID=168488 RepID=A0AAV6WJU0_9LAMI|nr:hypothetical protein BUALT_Bualt13G0024000 [Buddleja alternifolia]
MYVARCLYTKDHPECKSRPDSGLSAITELDPGYITGMHFKTFVRILSQTNFKSWLTENVYLKHFSAGSKMGCLAHRCDENEFNSNYSGWPANIVNIELPSIRDGTLFRNIADLDRDGQRLLYQLEESGNLVDGKPGAASGDETVPYHSLSWCKNWLGSKVNITRAPQLLVSLTL